MTTIAAIYGLVAHSVYNYADATSTRCTCTRLPARLSVPMVSVATIADITGLGVSVTLRQTYAHPFDRPSSDWHDEWHTLECSYTFPLDERACVTSFEADLGGRRVTGILRERKEARQEYEQARRAGRRTALLERETAQSNVFTCSVGRLRPGETCTVDITYLAPLNMESATCTRFTMPLTLAPKYNPSLWPLPVPTTERPAVFVYHPWTLALVNGATVAAPIANLPPYIVTFPRAYRSTYRPVSTVESTTSAKGLRPSLHTFTLRASICTAAPLHSVTCMHHKVTTTPIDAHSMAVEMQTALDDTRLVVFEIRHGEQPAHAVLEVSDRFAETSSSSATPSSPSSSIDAYTGAIQIAIPHLALSAFDQIQLSCELVFLLDCSGSMGGQPMTALRRTMQLLLRSLPTNCRFNIIRFGSSYVPLFPASMPYTSETMAAAEQLIASLEASLGGTEIAQPLSFALQQPSVHGFPRQVFLLTDGQVSGVNELCEFVERHVNVTRVFTFGIGSAVDANLCRSLARAGRGEAEFISVDSDQAMSEKVMKQVGRALQPMIYDVRVNWGAYGSVEERTDGVQQQIAAPVARNPFRPPRTDARSFESADGGAAKAALEAKQKQLRAFQQCPREVVATFAGDSGSLVVYALNVTLPKGVVAQLYAHAEQKRVRRAAVDASSNAQDDDDDGVPLVLDPLDPNAHSSFSIEFMRLVPGRGYEKCTVPLNLYTHVVQSDAIHRLAARARIEELEGVVDRPRTETDVEILALALKYGVVSRVTSFVATEPEKPAIRKAKKKSMAQSDRARPNKANARTSAAAEAEEDDVTEEEEEHSEKLDEDDHDTNEPLGGPPQPFSAPLYPSAMLMDASMMASACMHVAPQAYSLGSPGGGGVPPGACMLMSASSAAMQTERNEQVLSRANAQLAEVEEVGFATLADLQKQKEQIRSIGRNHDSVSIAGMELKACSFADKLSKKQVDQSQGMFSRLKSWVTGFSSSSSSSPSPTISETSASSDSMLMRARVASAAPAPVAPSCAAPTYAARAPSGAAAAVAKSSICASLPPFDQLVQSQQAVGSWSLDDGVVLRMLHAVDSSASHVDAAALTAWASTHSLDVTAVATLLAMHVIVAFFPAMAQQAQLMLAKAQLFLTQQHQLDRNRQDELTREIVTTLLTSSS